MACCAGCRCHLQFVRHFGTHVEPIHVHAGDTDTEKHGGNDGKGKN